MTLMVGCGVANVLGLFAVSYLKPNDTLSENTWNESDTVALADEFGLLGLIEHMVGCAVTEEVLFRTVPMVVLGWIGGRHARLFQLGGSVLVAAVFGYLHGGWANVFLQGVTGWVLSLIYLRTLARSRSHALALFHSARAHLFFNLALVFLVGLAP